MKLLFISKYYPSYFRHYANHMAKQGHEVVILSEFQRKNSQLPLARHITVRFMSVTAQVVAGERLMISYLRRGTAFGAAMRKLKAQGFLPDHLYVDSTSGCGLYCAQVFPGVLQTACFEYFFPAALPLGLGEGEGSELARYNSMYLRNLFQLDMLTQCNLGLVRTAWQMQSFPPEFRHKLQVASEGVDTTFFAPAASGSKPAEILDKIKLTPNTKLITHVARSLNGSGPFATFYRALPEVLATNPHCKVLIIGKIDESEANSLAALRQSVVLDSDRVQFLDNCTPLEYLAVLQASALHVFTFNGPSLSPALLEALSCGCLVLAVRNAPVEEIVQHGVNGLLSPFSTPAALAAAMQQALDSPHEALRQKARESILEKHTLQHGINFLEKNV